MLRTPSVCDFCGSCQQLQQFATDVPGIDWYACADCVVLIRNEDWNGLIDRGVAAYTTLSLIPAEEQCALHRQVENLVKAFRMFCLQPV